jgi:starvation-inducible outer membrane lipoprotein
MRWAFALAGALALAGCHEIPQTATKPFASAPAERQLGETNAPALAARAQGQNEYVRMGDAPK